MKPGQPPGFGGLPQTETDPDRSQVGEWLANAGYGLAALLAYFSARRVPSAVTRSIAAAGNLVNLSDRREEAQRLKAWAEAIEKARPEATGRLKDAQDRYEAEFEKLRAHLDVETRGTEAEAHQAIDAHLDALLKLPLLQRRTTVRETLEGLIASWKRDRNAEPLEAWLGANLRYDAIRTSNGAKWLGEYRSLRQNAAALAWKGRGTFSGWEGWLSSPAFGGEVPSLEWRRHYEFLKREEQRAAERFAREGNEAVRGIFGHEIRPTVSLAPPRVREPGQFLFHYVGESGELGPDGVLTAFQGPCEARMKALAANASFAARAASWPRQLGKLLWPAAPLAGTAVGGYYTVEGVRYWVLSPKDTK